MMMEIIFWWNIPCAGMINVLKAYAEEIAPSAIVVTGELSKSRKAMGWRDKGKLFSNHIILSDDKWDEQGRELIDKYKDRLHVFNGITYTPRMKRLIEYAIQNNVAFCNMSEAYYNLEKGFKRIVKSIFLAAILPSQVKYISKKSRGVICLSGGCKRDLKQFHRLGFKKVYPFGYFTDEVKEFPIKKKTNGQVHILCPGLLEHYKGVDILISALSILQGQGISNYICHITGTGSEKETIVKQVEKSNLADNVIFEGVLDVDKYNHLLTLVDILVAPGRVEPWGIRINEAIQRGNVVLVSDGIGANCLIQESGGGAVFKSGSAKDLASKLKTFLISDEMLSDAKMRNMKYRNTISCLEQAKRLKTYIEDML